MKYEEMKKEDLVKICKDYELKCDGLREDNFVLEEHRRINENMLRENVKLKEIVENLETTRKSHCREIDNLREQIEIYKNCLDVISRIRGE